MSLRTPKLDLPYIAPAQAQKHVTHNEAYARWMRWFSSQYWRS